ncbi:MAG: response regulator [bacterium]|nr:response regulator [bacterium]
MEKKKILVVEDDSVLRDVLITKLNKTGYIALGAEDGEVAMEVMRKDKPDLILLDILMPKKDGMQVMEEMNQDENLKNIPIVVVSNSGQPVEIERAKNLGARDFLIKAVFEPNEVLEKVDNILGRQNFSQNQADTSAAHIPETTTDTYMNNVTQASTPAPVNLNNTKIMVVEDDKFLRELLVRKLYSEGFVVESAIDATGAFEILTRFIPSLILLDLILPGVDGFEILSRIKKDNALSAIPVIILSNLGQKEDIERAMSLGAIDFMVKANFTLDEIASKAKKVVNGGSN